MSKKEKLWEVAQQVIVITGMIGIGVFIFLYCFVYEVNIVPIVMGLIK